MQSNAMSTFIKLSKYQMLVKNETIAVLIEPANESGITAEIIAPIENAIADIKKIFIIIPNILIVYRRS